MKAMQHRIRLFSHPTGRRRVRHLTLIVFCIVVLLNIATFVLPSLISSAQAREVPANAQKQAVPAAIATCIDANGRVDANCFVDNLNHCNPQPTGHTQQECNSFLDSTAQVRSLSCTAADGTLDRNCLTTVLNTCSNHAEFGGNSHAFVQAVCHTAILDQPNYAPPGQTPTCIDANGRVDANCFTGMLNQCIDNPGNYSPQQCSNFLGSMAQVRSLSCVAQDGTVDANCLNNLEVACSQHNNTNYAFVQTTCGFESTFKSSYCADPQHISTGVCTTNTSSNTDPNSTPNGNNNTYKALNDKVQNPFGPSATLFFNTPTNVTIGSNQVLFLWGFMLAVVDVCMVVTIMLNGLKLMWAGSAFRYSTAVESLPGTLIALICAHVSLLFISFFLAFNNDLTTAFVRFVVTDTRIQRSQSVDAQKNPVTSGHNKCIEQNSGTNNPLFIFPPVTCYVLGLFSPGDPYFQEQQVNISDLSIVPQSLDIPDFFGSLSSLANIIGMIFRLLGIMLLLQMIIRLFFIDFYIVLAPIGIAAWALPGRAGQPLTQLWFQGFISTVMVQSVQVVALVISQLLLGLITGYVHNNVVVNGGPLSDQMLGDLIRIACLLFVLRIPSLLGTAPMRSMIEAGQSIQQAVTTMMAVSIAEAQAVTSAAASAGGAVVSVAALAR